MARPWQAFPVLTIARAARSESEAKPRWVSQLETSDTDIRGVGLIELSVTIIDDIRFICNETQTAVTAPMRARIRRSHGCDATLSMTRSQ